MAQTAYNPKANITPVLEVLQPGKRARTETTFDSDSSLTEDESESSVDEPVSDFIDPSSDMSADAVVDYLSRVNSIQLIKRLVRSIDQTSQLGGELEEKKSKIKKLSAHTRKVHAGLEKSEGLLVATKRLHDEAILSRNELERRNRELEEALGAKTARFADKTNESEETARQLIASTADRDELSAKLQAQIRLYDEIARERNSLRDQQATSTTMDSFIAVVSAKVGLQEKVRTLEASLVEKDDLLLHLKHHQQRSASTAPDAKPLINNSYLEHKIRHLTTEIESLEEQAQVKEDTAKSVRRSLEDKNT